ncbi:hypothetical protein BDV41DRAFT_572371 [Aspergillus transmontanensis]|uniref:Uncharacterized protein n=1 Tax=Aspergillus transmontanensis TaxID=1034304 RepID=A0A5N6WAL6_9EURO|nr:hypothetical protein BDV41DRAFT_572371 [Aspergillus transmontanensis]
MVKSSFLDSVSHSPTFPEPPSTFVLSDPPYDNYFYLDCNVAAPGGNSGVRAYVALQNGANGSLEIQAVQLDVGDPLVQVYTSPGSSKYPGVVVKGVLHIDSSATLTVPILDHPNQNQESKVSTSTYEPHFLKDIPLELRWLQVLFLMVDVKPPYPKVRQAIQVR